MRSVAAGAEGRWGEALAFGLRLMAGLGAATLLLLCSVGIAAPADEFLAGRRAYQAGDVTGSLQLLRKPADAGHAPSQALLGFVLDSAGLYDEAVAYYRKAVEQGDADGEYGLANSLLSGNGVARDGVAARGLFERAAGKGHALAIQWLAESALSKLPRPVGAGAASSSAAAASASGAAPASVAAAAPAASAPPALAADELAWVTKAAANDHLGSLDYLARAYRHGVIGPPDLALAKDFENRAEKLRYPNGRPRVRRGN